MGQGHMHWLLVLKSRGVPYICKGTRQGHLARPPSCAKKWDDCFPSECLCLWYHIFLLCLLLGARWHHDNIFLLFIGLWQTQDADSYTIIFPRSWVDFYIISFLRSWTNHHMLINTHYSNGIKSTRPWWRWWFDILWMTFTRLWPTYSCHVYFGVARNDTKWLPSKYFIWVPFAISSIILFCPLCFIG